MKIFSAAQIHDWDSFTIKSEPISGVGLMERAATACFKWFKKNNTTLRPIIICCGNGNNGADGLAIARLLLKAKYTVAVYLLSNNKKTIECSINLNRLTALKCSLCLIKTTNDFPSISKNTVVIDALFGTGLNRPLKGIAAQLVNYINNKSSTTISIDIPSGLTADMYLDNKAIIKATHTLSFETYKLAFLLPENTGYTGQLHVLPIGLSKKYYTNTVTLFETIDQTLISKIYKPRNAFAHKYTFGHALLYAGSKNMMGAALLCTKACLRAGSGLATVRVSPGCEAIIQTALPEAITISANTHIKNWIKKSAIAIGPGIENTTKNNQLLKMILSDWDRPLVVDATALSLLTPLIRMLPLRKIHPAILTPHTGEFEKIFGKTTTDFERLQLVTEKATTLNCYIILKGHYTLIACPDGMHYFNTTGNAGMATAGSGDVLTGILTGLLAQGYSEKEACLLGVYLHGFAGDIAAENLSQEAMIAGDIINYLGEAFKKINQYKS